jgi:hypothetical protein
VSHAERVGIRCIDCSGAAGGFEVFAAEEGDDVFESEFPAAASDFGFGAEGGDVEGDGEAFEGTVEIEDGGAEDALESGFGMLEALGAAGDAVEAILLLVGGGEDGTLAPEEVDVAGEAVEGVFGGEHELEAEGLDLVGGVFEGERPGVALGGEEGRTCGVEGAEGAAERGEEFGFGDVGDVVGVGAKVDEAGGAVWVKPWDDEGGGVV